MQHPLLLVAGLLNLVVVFCVAKDFLSRDKGSRKFNELLTLGLMLLTAGLNLGMAFGIIPMGILIR